MNQNWNNGRGPTEAQYMNMQMQRVYGSMGQAQQRSLPRPITADDQAKALGLPPLKGSDRELLMLAAKAAGIAWPQPVWNPLTDDGAALRLAVNLNLVIVVDDQLVHVEFRSVTAPFKVTEECEAHNWNRLTATRRAIVRAAAEIGKQLDR